jgi:uncharacterized protein (DUF885 family)
MASTTRKPRVPRLQRPLRLLLRSLGAALLLALLAAAALAAHTWFARPLHIRLFYERAFAQQALRSPQMLSSLRLLPRWLDWASDDLNDYSPAEEERKLAQARAHLATLRSYERTRLDDPVSYDVLEHWLASQVEGERFLLHNYPVNPVFGVQGELPSFLASQHPVASEGDAADYLARLRAIPRALDQLVEGLQRREALGIVPPAVAVEKVLAQMKGFAGQAPDQNILVQSLAPKLEAAGIAAPRRQALLQQARTIFTADVVPAYGRLIQQCEGLLRKTRGNHGVWSLPDGEAYYAWLVRRHTTTTRTPQEVHDLGLAEVARIGAEMQAILAREGLTEGTLGERMRALSERPDQLYPDTDAGRQQILQDYQAIIDAIQPRLDAWFDLRPRQGVRVERVPVFREKTSARAYYQAPALDGSRPGVFYANLNDIRDSARLGMRTLAYHEAIPGHHFQKALQRELQGLPTFRKVLGFTAFAEGWALYAERLAAEMGAFPTPLDDLGRLRAEMFRAARLVVDTGMHYKRWGREQAINYLREQTGMADSAVISEIDRYLVNPGQALAYKVGMNEILRLREQARAELGTRFDIRRFHNLVLGGGDLPLAVLERRVADWIVSMKSPPP